MYKMFLISLGLLLSSVSHAQYFYYWVDEYEANRTADNSVYINTHLKSSDLNSFTFTVNDYIIAKDIEMFPDEIVDFPIHISSKYTKEDKVKVCALKQNTDLTFHQQVCLDIKLY